MEKILFSLKDHNRLLLLHSQGLSDRDIAQSWVGRFFSAETVRRWRINNQLPSNRLSENHRRRMSDAKKKAAFSPSKKIRVSACVRSVDEGWSSPLTRNERRLAECLLDGGKTIHELRLLLGRPSLSKLLTSMRTQGLIIKKKAGMHTVIYSLAKRLTKTNVA
jgi:hypothetical protein